MKKISGATVPIFNEKRLSIKLKLMFLMSEAKTGGEGRQVGLPNVSHAVLVGLGAAEDQRPALFERMRVLRAARSAA